MIEDDFNAYNLTNQNQQQPVPQIDSPLLEAADEIREGAGYLHHRLSSQGDDTRLLTEHLAMINLNQQQP